MSDIDAAENEGLAPDLSVHDASGGGEDPVVLDEDGNVVIEGSAERSGVPVNYLGDEQEFVADPGNGVGEETSGEEFSEEKRAEILEEFFGAPLVEVETVEPLGTLSGYAPDSYPEAQANGEQFDKGTKPLVSSGKNEESKIESKSVVTDFGPDDAVGKNTDEQDAAARAADAE